MRLNEHYPLMEGTIYFPVISVVLILVIPLTFVVAGYLICCKQKKTKLDLSKTQEYIVSSKREQENHANMNESDDRVQIYRETSTERTSDNVGTECMTDNNPENMKYHTCVKLSKVDDLFKEDTEKFLPDKQIAQEAGLNRQSNASIDSGAFTQTQTLLISKNCSLNAGTICADKDTANLKLSNALSDEFSNRTTNADEDPSPPMSRLHFAIIDEVEAIKSTRSPSLQRDSDECDETLDEYLMGKTRRKLSIVELECIEAEKREKAFENEHKLANATSHPNEIHKPAKVGNIVRDINSNQNNPEIVITKPEDTTPKVFKINKDALTTGTRLKRETKTESIQNVPETTTNGKKDNIPAKTSTQLQISNAKNGTPIIDESEAITPKPALVNINNNPTSNKKSNKGSVRFKQGFEIIPDSDYDDNESIVARNIRLATERDQEAEVLERLQRFNRTASHATYNDKQNERSSNDLISNKVTENGCNKNVLDLGKTTPNRGAKPSRVNTTNANKRLGNEIDNDNAENTQLQKKSWLDGKSRPTYTKDDLDLKPRNVMVKSRGAVNYSQTIGVQSGRFLVEKELQELRNRNKDTRLVNNVS